MTIGMTEKTDISIDHLFYCNTTNILINISWYSTFTEIFLNSDSNSLISISIRLLFA